jgi:aminoglycoside phosphotransferase (APT) family kinase protein
VAEKGQAALDEITSPRVLHGDPWPKNVLIRREPDGPSRIVALLDHERGLFGDPLSEWVFNGFDFPPVFWEAYGARPTDPAARVRAGIYRGMIDIQCLLEEPRYAYDATVHRRRLATEAEALPGLLAEV